MIHWNRLQSVYVSESRFSASFLKICKVTQIRFAYFVKSIAYDDIKHSTNVSITAPTKPMFTIVLLRSQRRVFKNLILSPCYIHFLSS